MEKGRTSKTLDKTIQIADCVFFGAFLVAITVLLWRLVICQAIYAGRSDGYLSDILAYMQEMQGIESGYSFPYPLFFTMGRLFNRFMPIGTAVALSEVILNGLAVVFTKYYFDKEIRRNLGNDKSFVYLLSTVAVICCFVMSMWWLPRFGKITLPWKDQAFVGTFTGNPWHNATYIATRPFAVVCFFSFINVLRTYETKIKVIDACIFTLSLFLTTITKPSFTIVLLSAAGLVWIVRLIKARFTTIKQSLLVLVCLIPTVIDLIYQFGGVFGDGNEEEVHGIGFTFFEVWKGHNPNVAAAVFYANVFSLVCLVIMFKELKKDELYRFGSFFFLISFLEAGLLCEKGKRFTHFNFCWGYMHGIFFLQAVSLIKLVRATVTRRYRWYVILLLWLALLSQVVAGAVYFWYIYCGRDYKTLLPMTWIE